jgi:hypothetical protein
MLTSVQGSRFEVQSSKFKVKGIKANIDETAKIPVHHEGTKDTKLTA